VFFWEVLSYHPRIKWNFYIFQFLSNISIPFLLISFDIKSLSSLREPVAQIPICHPELVSGSRNSLTLLDAETSSA